MKFNAIYAVAALVAGSNARPQAIPSPHYTQTHVKVGDGSPRQAYLYEQLYTDAHCGGAGNSCSISQMEITSSSHSWSLGLSGVGNGAFISGGFAVTETKSTGSTVTCQAGGDSGTFSVCVWGRIAHTGYEVDTYRHLAGTNPEGGEHLGRSYIWAPNEDSGHGFVCAHDYECEDQGVEWWGHKSQGDALWAEDTNAVGPEPFVWGPEPENRWN